MPAVNILDASSLLYLSFGLAVTTIGEVIILSASYFINCALSMVLPGVTPFENLFHQKWVMPFLEFLVAFFFCPSSTSWMQQSVFFILLFVFFRIWDECKWYLCYDKKAKNLRVLQCYFLEAYFILFFSYFLHYSLKSFLCICWPIYGLGFFWVYCILSSSSSSLSTAGFLSYTCLICNGCWWLYFTATIFSSTSQFFFFF